MFLCMGNSKNLKIMNKKCTFTQNWEHKREIETQDWKGTHKWGPNHLKLITFFDLAARYLVKVPVGSLVRAAFFKSIVSFHCFNIFLSLELRCFTTTIFKMISHHPFRWSSPLKLPENFRSFVSFFKYEPEKTSFTAFSTFLQLNVLSTLQNFD